MLLADDHSIVRRGLARPAGICRAARWLPRPATGWRPCGCARSTSPDIVILDIGMPKLSGIEVAARAQKMERPPGVIILSVHGDESYIMRALAAGRARVSAEERHRRRSDSGRPGGRAPESRSSARP